MLATRPLLRRFRVQGYHRDVRTLLKRHSINPSFTYGVLTCLVLTLWSASALSDSTSSDAQSPRVPIYFRHISVQEGLSQVTVSDLLQDNKGFMWFATQNGINRYDGYTLVQYKRDKQLDGSGPIGEFAYKLALDDESSDIWVATSGGLSRYQYASDSFRHYELIGLDGEQRFIVPAIVVDRRGQVWAGTRQGLFAYDEETDSFTPIALDISAAAWVLDIERDKSGELLVATTEGLLAIREPEPFCLLRYTSHVTRMPTARPIASAGNPTST